MNLDAESKSESWQFQHESDYNGQNVWINQKIKQPVNYNILCQAAQLLKNVEKTDFVCTSNKYLYWHALTLNFSNTFTCMYKEWNKRNLTTKI